MFNPQQHLIHTERLRLRPVQEQDRELVVDLYTDPQIMRNIAKPFSPESANQHFDSALATLKLASPAAINWVICEQESNQAIGLVTLFKFQGNQATVGIMLLRKANGKLYPEEALAAVLRHGFLSLHLEEIYGQFYIRNLAAKRYMEKLGFEFLPVSDGADTHHCVMKKANWLTQHAS